MQKFYTVINFLSIKGLIEPTMRLEASFSDINSNGINGLFAVAVAIKFISLIEVINGNAQVA